MLLEQQRKDFLKERALTELFSSEILEWYRVQYNIPLDVFYKQQIDEDIAHIDFYRRQYWNEIRFGIRKWGDNDLELQMPPFTLYRQFGGILPPPNGYDFDNTYTVKSSRYKAPSTSNSKDTQQSYQTSYTSSTQSSQSFSPSNREERTVYQMGKEEFNKMMEKITDNQDDVWEDLEKMNFENE